MQQQPEINMLKLQYIQILPVYPGAIAGVKNQLL